MIILSYFPEMYPQRPSIGRFNDYMRQPLKLALEASRFTPLVSVIYGGGESASSHERSANAYKYKLLKTRPTLYKILEHKKYIIFAKKPALLFFLLKFRFPSFMVNRTFRFFFAVFMNRYLYNHRLLHTDSIVYLTSYSADHYNLTQISMKNYKSPNFINGKSSLFLVLYYLPIDRYLKKFFLFFFLRNTCEITPSCLILMSVVQRYLPISFLMLELFFFLPYYTKYHRSPRYYRVRHKFSKSLLILNF